MQSCEIFSGTQMCGTIVKPMRTKCDGSCVKAHSVEKPLALPVVATLLTRSGPMSTPAERLGHDQ